MIESFGFEVHNDKGGRPISCDPEAVLAELTRRYEGRPKPRTIKALFEENADIGGNLKTIHNVARKHFGRSLGKELEERELIERAPAKSVPPQTGRAGRSRKPVPETAEILAALDDMERRLGGVPIEDRPSSMASLCRWFPEHESLVTEGRKRGVVSKEALRQRGILRPSKNTIAAEQRRSRLSHVRSQGLPALLERYKSLNGPSLVTRDRAEALLRDGVLGFDVASMSELRETRLPVENVWPMSVGDAPSVEIIRFDVRPHALRRGLVRISSGAGQGFERVVRRSIPGPDEFISAERFEGETPFGAETGARVEGTFTLAGIPFAALRYRFVVPLSP